MSPVRLEQINTGHEEEEEEVEVEVVVEVEVEGDFFCLHAVTSLESNEEAISADSRASPTSPQLL